MKANKDFHYYGKKRFKVKRILSILDKDKNDNSLLYMFVSFVLAVLCFNLENILHVDLGYVGGVLSFICFFEFIWIVGNTITYFVCIGLDKYYLSKRVELFKKYLEEKKASSRTRNNTKD